MVTEKRVKQELKEVPKNYNKATKEVQKCH